MSISLSLPWPPSNNAMYRQFRGRAILSAAGRDYRYAVALTVIEAGSPKVDAYPVAVWIEACPPDRRKRDCDNIPKGVLDALVTAEVLASDDNRHIAFLGVSWGAGVPDGEVRVFIAPASLAPPIPGDLDTGYSPARVGA